MDDGRQPHSIIVRRSINHAKDELARAMRRKMTEAESILWDCVRAKRLGGLHFRRQTTIGGYIADFYCHEAALCVEVDGSMHDPEYDHYRDKVFADEGIEVIRVTNIQVERSLDLVLRQTYARAVDRIARRRGKGSDR